jgi:FkbM family methyltransferase
MVTFATSMARPSVSVTMADILARTALRAPIVERALAAATRKPLLRQYLRLGAIAHGVARVLGKHELRIAEMDGYRFYVNLGEPQGVESYFFKEPGTYWLTPDLVRPGDICVDAGANAGVYTFLCASIVAPTGRVFAFEPNPRFADMLRRSKTLNAFGDIIQVEQRALYSVSGEKKRFYLSVNPMNSGTSSLSENGTFLSPETAIDVSTVTIDDFAHDNKIERFRFVKIDVEHVEEFVIAGAAAVLRDYRIDYMILETFAGARAQELMLQAGYRGFLLDQAHRKLIPIADVSPKHFGDFLFVRPGAPVP